MKYKYPTAAAFGEGAFDLPPLARPKPSFQLRAANAPPRRDYFLLPPPPPPPPIDFLTDEARDFRLTGAAAEFSKRDRILWARQRKSAITG